MAQLVKQLTNDLAYEGSNTTDTGTWWKYYEKNYKMTSVSGTVGRTIDKWSQVWGFWFIYHWHWVKMAEEFNSYWLMSVVQLVEQLANKSKFEGSNPGAIGTV